MGNCWVVYVGVCLFKKLLKLDEAIPKYRVWYLGTCTCQRATPARWALGPSRRTISVQGRTGPLEPERWGAQSIERIEQGCPLDLLRTAARGILRHVNRKPSSSSSKR